MNPLQEQGLVKPLLAIREIKGVLVYEFLSGKAQWSLPYMLECEIMPWYYASALQILYVYVFWFASLYES